MFCTKCQNHVVECECDDIDERLAELAKHPNFVTSRCENCRETPDCCDCDEYSPI